MSGFYIGNVKIDGDLALGPMAGVTDMPFRTICKEFGADLLYTEMISAKGIYYKNKNTEPLWQIDDTEHPIALQLFGSEPELMADMAEQIEKRNFDILDINMGCPASSGISLGSAKYSGGEIIIDAGAIGGALGQIVLGGKFVSDADSVLIDFTNFDQHFLDDGNFYDIMTIHHNS